MTETEYDLHTKGARHSFDNLASERPKTDLGHHNDLCVQLCRKVGLSDPEIDTLLSLATVSLREECFRLRTENRLLKHKLARQQEWMDSVGAGGVSGQRITGSRYE